jgi:hypothetical protein
MIVLLLLRINILPAEGLGYPKKYGENFSRNIIYNRRLVTSSLFPYPVPTFERQIIGIAIRYRR